MGKPTIRIGEKKGADQLRSNCEADQRLCFRNSDSTIPFLRKFEVSSSFLCLYWSAFVGPVRKSHCWFPRGGSFYSLNTHKYMYLAI